MDRKAKPDIHRSEQGVLNRSFDEKYQVLAVENLYHNPSTDTLDTTQPEYATRIDDTVSNTVYIGKAQVGSVTSDPVWQIAKLDTSSGLVKTWAGTGFDQIWDNRNLLNYQ